MLFLCLAGAGAGTDSTAAPVRPRHCRLPAVLSLSFEGNIQGTGGWRLRADFLDNKTHLEDKLRLIEKLQVGHFRLYCVSSMIVLSLT